MGWAWGPFMGKALALVSDTHLLETTARCSGQGVRPPREARVKGRKSAALEQPVNFVRLGSDYRQVNKNSRSSARALRPPNTSPEHNPSTAISHTA